MSCVGRRRHALPSSWQDASSRPRGAKRPGRCKNFRPEEGAGKAGCALHPRSRVQDARKNAHTSIQVQRRQSGLPCAMVLTAYFVLSPVIGLSCHRRPAKTGEVRARLGRLCLSRDLTPASRRQDHTTSPSAAVLRQGLRRAWYPSAEVRAKAPLASFVSALHHRSRPKPPLRHFPRPTLPRPPHPAPTFVTMANAPLRSRTRGVIE